MTNHKWASVVSAKVFDGVVRCRSGRIPSPHKKHPVVCAPGFTVVELLVVIAITSILIAMLLPSIMKARTAAINLKCLSNLRQLQMGVMLHAQSHDGYGPLSGTCWGPINDSALRRYDYFNPASYLPTFTAIRAALGYQRLASGVIVPTFSDGFVRGMMCPAQDPNDGWYGTVMSVQVNAQPSSMEYTSYAANDEVLGAPSWNQTTRPLGNLAKVHHPSEVFLFADTLILGINANANAWWWDANWVGSYTPAADKSQSTCADFYTLTVVQGHFNNGNGAPDISAGRGRHNGAINFVFVDGHAETVHTRPPRTAADTQNNLGLLGRIGLAKGIYN